METTYAAALMWFRRDLRAEDNAALSQALRAAGRVHCVFVFDRAILDPLPRCDRRVEFIRESALALDADLRALGRPGPPNSRRRFLPSRNWVSSPPTCAR